MVVMCVSRPMRDVSAYVVVYSGRILLGGLPISGWREFLTTGHWQKCIFHNSYRDAYRAVLPISGLVDHLTRPSYLVPLGTYLELTGNLLGSTEMAILDLAAWGVFGACVQGLAQGIRHKPLNYKPAGYAISAAAFVGVGVLLDRLRATQKDFIDRRVSTLAQERANRGVTFSRD